tara:strand:- start:449 stop:967 length:519 start_codon:yes stop_codon:yes gene_type:complete
MQNFESLANKRNQRKGIKKDSYNLKPNNNSLSIEDDLIMLCFSEEKEIREEIYKHLNLDWIINDNTRRIYNVIYLHLNSSFEPQAEIIIDQLEEREDKNKLAGLLSESEKIHPTIEMAKNAIKRLHYNYLIKKMESLREKLKNSEKDFEDGTILINEISVIQNSINNLKVNL